MALIDYLSPEKIEEAGTNWDELTAIQNDFEKKAPSYEQAAQAITSILLKTHGVHSVRYRIKDPTHLLEKVVRKRLENKERLITIDNYEEELTDLAGVRILHLFKEDWQRIHEFINSTWGLYEKPTAYYRKGDSPEILAMFTEQECEVKEHPAGYRSVHYIAETSLTKSKRYVEIQVRTIFEEGWSEVDHKIRYPNFSDNPLTNQLLMLLNRLAGSADEMSSLVRGMLDYIKNSKSELDKLESEKNEQIKKLEEIIKTSDIPAKDKVTLESVAKSLSNAVSTASDLQQFLNPSLGISGLQSLNSISSILGNKQIDRLGNKLASGYYHPGVSLAMSTQLDKLSKLDKLIGTSNRLDEIAKSAEKVNQTLKKANKLNAKPKPKL